MAKLIQITASQNDLFGLDSDGVVCQYNFNTNNWMALGDERGGRDDSVPRGSRPRRAAEGRCPAAVRVAAPPARRAAPVMQRRA